MNAYIELLAARPIEAYDVFFRHELTDGELREIGKFTRENILDWMENNENHRGVDWVDKIPVRDFRAVCGDTEIPWQNERHREMWNKWGCSNLPSFTTFDGSGGSK